MLSVIIPNYNHAHLIGRALDALITQSRPPEEIIIVDDASTDNGREILKHYAVRFPQIRILINDKNIGHVASINRGLEVATGRYVYFAAADDWVEPGFFTLAVAMLDNHPQAAMFCGEVRVIAGETGQALGTRPPVRPRARAGYVGPELVPGLMRRKGHWIVTCGSIFRRDHVIAVGGLDVALGSFADSFLARKLALIHGFFFAPQIVATWNVFHTGQSRQAASAIESAKPMLAVAQEKIASDPSFPDFYVRTYNDLWRFSTARLAVAADPVDHVMLQAMANQTKTDDIALKMIWSLLPDRLARFVTLAWLWFRLRPYSLFDLIRTAMARRFQ